MKIARRRISLGVSTAMAVWLLLFECAQFAHAVTQEEVFKSLNENMHEEPDYSLVIPFFLAVAGIIMVIVYMRQRQKHEALPKIVHHPGKLQREMIRVVELDPREMKQLQLKADELNCEHALTLLLCPSLMNKPDAEQPTPEAETDA